MRVYENTIHLMKQDNEGHDLAQVNDLYIKKICNLFGGCTVTHAMGYWFDSDGQKYVDEVLRIQTAFDLTEENKQKFLDLAEQYKAAARQLCVYVVLDSQVKFV